jgi:predicted RNA polymerase sigma factor
VKIRKSNVQFQVPETTELEKRVADLLRAIYAAFGAG